MALTAVIKRETDKNKLFRIFDLMRKKKKAQNFPY